MRHKRRKGQLIAAGCAILIVLGACIWLGIRQVTPLRAPVPVGVGLGENDGWSQVRSHLANISSSPHPTGSRANGQVRDTILSILQGAGYAPAIDRQEVTGQEVRDIVTQKLGFSSSTPLDATFVIENIVAELLPADYDPSQHATLLACVHYDSVPGAPGAGDNGAALAGFLEAACEIARIPEQERKNRIILLITDGEELGLIGAVRFVQAHPEIVNQAAMVINFEARGNAGTPLMFETGDPNAAPIAMLQRLPKPVAFSYLADIYRTMPNYTDFSVFLWAGKSGLNFANIDGAQHYHQPTDDIAHLSTDTLYTYAELTRAALLELVSVDVGTWTGTSNMYFTFMPGNLVVFPLWLGTALAWGALALTLLLCALMLRARRMRWTRMLLAFPLLVAGLFCAITMAYGVGLAAKAIFGATALQGGGAAIAMLITMLAIIAPMLYAFAILVLKLLRPSEWSAVLALLCALGACGLTMFMPGSSYLLSLPALLLATCAAAQSVSARWLTCPLTALPTTLVIALLFAPMVYLVYLAMGVDMLHICGAIAAAALLMVYAGFSPMFQPEKWTGHARAHEWETEDA